jgi:hypothetical protein
MSARLIDRLFVAVLSLIVIGASACGNQSSQTPAGRSLIVDAVLNYDDLDPARGYHKPLPLSMRVSTTLC